LDPLDAEALASGGVPVCATDAAEHARLCPSCARAVSEAASLARALDDLGDFPVADVGKDLPEAADLAGNVVRIRPFSRRELRDFALWRGPSLFTGALFLSGLVLLLLPGVTAREQAGLALAALAPAAALARALVRSLAEIVAVSPAGLEALGFALRGESAVGLACLLLLAPAFWGFSRALARGRRR